MGLRGKSYIFKSSEEAKNLLRGEMRQPCFGFAWMAQVSNENDSSQSSAIQRELNTTVRAYYFALFSAHEIGDIHQAEKTDV